MGTCRVCICTHSPSCPTGPGPWRLYPELNFAKYLCRWHSDHICRQIECMLIVDVTNIHCLDWREGGWSQGWLMCCTIGWVRQYRMYAICRDESHWSHICHQIECMMMLIVTTIAWGRREWCTSFKYGDTVYHICYAEMRVLDPTSATK